MRILDLTFTHVGHPFHRGRMADVESHKGAALASRLAVRFFVVAEERAKRIFQQPGLSQLFDVIAGFHSPAFGPSGTPLRRLHQQRKNRGITLTCPGAGVLTSPRVVASPKRAYAPSSRCSKKGALMTRPEMTPCSLRLLPLSLSLSRLVCSKKGVFAGLGVAPRATSVRDVRAF